MRGWLELRVIRQGKETAYISRTGSLENSCWKVPAMSIRQPDTKLYFSLVKRMKPFLVFCTLGLATSGVENELVGNPAEKFWG